MTLSEIQPWQREPELTHAQTAEVRQVAEPRLFGVFRGWWPAILWAAVIFSLSTDTFSAEHTGSVLQRLVGWLHLSEDQFAELHFFIRKCAHFAEYFVFCLLIYRGIRGPRQGWRWLWGLSAWFAAAAYSALDEVHQAFVASRTASAYDSLLDSVGAFIAVIVLYIYFRPPVPTAPVRQKP